MNDAKELLGAVARGWCHPKNSGKVFDPDLAIAIAAEVSALSNEADSGTKRDVARLDWLEQQSAHGLIIDIVADWTYNGRRYGAGMRDAIDAAMSARSGDPHE